MDVLVCRKCGKELTRLLSVDGSIATDRGEGGERLNPGQCARTIHTEACYDRFGALLEQREDPIFQMNTADIERGAVQESYDGGSRSSLLCAGCSEAVGRLHEESFAPVSADLLCAAVEWRAERKGRFPWLYTENPPH